MLGFAGQVKAFHDELLTNGVSGVLHDGITDAEIGFSTTSSLLLETAGYSGPPFEAAQDFFFAARAARKDLDATSEGVREVLRMARELVDKIGQVAGGDSFEGGLSTIHSSHAGMAADQAENALAVLDGHISAIAG